MTFASSSNTRGPVSFRTKLLVAMMLVVSALTILGLYLAQRKVVATAERDLQQSFQAEISSLHKIQELRHLALEERCRELVSKPHIHAALEDNALDLLYPSAKDELHDLMQGDESSTEKAASSLHAKFYRFLNDAGTVLFPPSLKDVGELSADAEAQLSLRKLPATQQIGYVAEGGADAAIDEIMTVPIVSTDTGDVISALVVGFEPFELGRKSAGAGLKSGIWVSGRLHLPSLAPSAQAALGDEITNVIKKSGRAQSKFTITVYNAPQLLFYKRLNPDSLFPPAYEICIYPLADSIGRLHRLRWQIGGAGGLLLLGGFMASRLVAGRLAVPVEKLALDSEENRAQRKRAEAALASTNEELKRSARYSSDASHQLKTPVTVLRAGLESLLMREDFQPEVYEELSGLLHQTRRLTGVIDDLLLLSRMDAGHLRIESAPVNLSQLITEWLDDLEALSDSLDVEIEKNFPPKLYIAGEKRYTSLIVQNLLENARKYNRVRGRIRITATRNNGEIVLTIGNSGRAIAAVVQQDIFERFHHPSNASGQGLGLNLARELARLHGGDLRLLSSADDWTEFEVRFRVAQAAPSDSAEVA